MSAARGGHATFSDKLSSLSDISLVVLWICDVKCQMYGRHVLIGLVHQQVKQNILMFLLLLCNRLSHASSHRLTAIHSSFRYKSSRKMTYLYVINEFLK